MEAAMRATLQHLSKHIDRTVYKCPQFFCIFSDLLCKCREKLPNTLLDSKDGGGGRTSPCGEKPVDPHVTLWWRFKYLFPQLCKTLQHFSSVISWFRVSWSSPSNPEDRYWSITDVMEGTRTSTCRAEPLCCTPETNSTWPVISTRA